MEQLRSRPLPAVAGTPFTPDAFTATGTPAPVITLTDPTKLPQVKPDRVPSAAGACGAADPNFPVGACHTGPRASAGVLNV
ncbi:hypothetical protein B2J88_50620 [Rhodococcus sp. SRB_17]|nr:hypothetical protein [Rhodococcus sp. SRB_17]